ncbi:MAG: MBL fold metallo-hydrolase [Bryobacterales bacterium]
MGDVTGSMHQVDVDGERFLLDCGLYQGRRSEARKRNRELPFPADSVAGVLLSHAHIDHSGNLPSLVRNGFSGPIYATPATADLCDKMLRDSAHIQEKDAEFLNRRRSRRRRLDPNLDPDAIEPLYTMVDAENTIPLFRQVGYKTPTVVSERLSYESYDAGHMLGSSSLVLHLKNGRNPLRLGFSGDVGRPGLPIIRDPQTPPPVDYLIMESTYGGRLHRAGQDVRQKLADVVRRTFERGGKVIVPAFAVGRTQQLVMLLNELTHEQKIPEAPIFVDSPLAVNVTEVFRAHPECYDAETREYLLDQRDPFAFGRLRYVRDVEESKALNDIPYPFIVLAASGMCEAGRILHHLRRHIPDPRNTVLITGYQAEHTLGRRILEGRREVPIFGDPTPLRAEVAKINELSGHADQHELLAWLKPLVPELKRIFLVHGEPAQSQALADAIGERFGVEAVLPKPGQSFTLS